jgi:Tfp pilus assembly protein PilN
MMKNINLLRWLSERPLIMVLKKTSRLHGTDLERHRVLLLTPVLAVSLIIGGGVGVGFAAISTTEATTTAEVARSQSSELMFSENQEVTESMDAPDFAAEAILAEAILAWGTPDIAAILTEEYPGAEWSLNGGTYEGLVWIGPGSKPAKAQLHALWPKIGQILADRREADQVEAEQKAAEQAVQQKERAADPIRNALVDQVDYLALFGPGPQYDKILQRHYPGAQWSLNGSSYSGLTWLSPGTKPTKATLDGLWNGVARELALQLPMSELRARAGESETEEYVDGTLRPKGFSDDTFTASPQNCRQLPQVAQDGGGSPVGLMEMSQYPDLDLTEIACRIAQAHGYFGGKFSLGVSINGCCTFMWYSNQVDPEKVRGVLASIGAMATAEPSPEPEPEPEPEPSPEPEEEEEAEGTP